MATLASTLLEFLLNLFQNPAAAAEFKADPEKALEEAGLSDVSTDDVDACLPVLLDDVHVEVNSSFDRDYNTGGNHTWGGNAGGGGGGGHHTDHGHAVQQLTHVLNNYSYTSVDDRDNIVDQSVNQNIWADGDVHQLFDNEAVIASGDHSNAAGDDVNVEDSYNDSHDIHVEDSFNDSHDIVDSYNEETKIEDSYNDNSDNSTDVKIEDSFNKEEETKIEDSYNETTEVDVKVEDSFNEETKIEDSYNETEVDVEIEDSFHKDSYNQEEEVKIEESLNEIEIEDSVHSDVEF